MTMPNPLEKLVEKNVATPNADASGAVSPTTKPTANASLPTGYGSDITGRIFKLDGMTPAPVVTSDDAKAEFDTGKSEIERRETALKENLLSSQQKADAEKNAEINPKFNEKTGRVEASSDPVSDALNKWEKEKNDAFEAEAAQRKASYQKLFDTSLASIDDATASMIQGINSSYDMRIDEQRRINAINVGRVKAYGLGGGGRFTPIDFSDAVTAREAEASKQILSLEGERNSLISQARSAANKGRTDLMRSNLKDLADIEDQMRTNLAKVHEEATKQYEVLRTLREDAERQHKEKLDEAQKRLALVASSYLGEYEGKDDAAKDKLIKSIMNKTGLDYASVFAQLEKASGDAALLKKNAAKDARGDLREVGGNLYQVTYDDKGNAKTTLVQQGKTKGGTGGGGSTTKLTPTDKKRMEARGLDPNNAEDVKSYIKEQYGDDDDDEEAMSFKDFENLAAQTVGADGKPLYNQSGADIKKKYDEYLAKLGGTKKQKSLTATDRKKMYAANLDPENPDDVEKFIKENYDPLK